MDESAEPRVSVFIRQRRYGFVLGVMACAAAIAVSGAVAAATHDGKRVVLGMEVEAPQVPEPRSEPSPEPRITVGPIEWPMLVSAPRVSPGKKCVPAAIRPTRLRH